MLGALLVALALALRPGAAGEGERAVVVRGPALARHDAANGTTHALFRCGHWHCDTAYLLEGDRTAEVARRGGMLVDPAGEGAWRRVPVAPLADASLPLPVATAYAGPFELEPTWPRLSLVVAGVSLLGVGACLLLARRVRVSRVAALTAPPVCVAPGAFAFAWGDGVVFALFLGTLAFCAALVLLPFARTRPVALALLVGLLFAVPAALLGAPYLPTEPSL